MHIMHLRLQRGSVIKAMSVGSARTIERFSLISSASSWAFFSFFFL